MAAIARGARIAMRRLPKLLTAVRRLSKAARQYDTSLYFQVKRFRRLHDEWLFSLNDALFWGLTDPALPEDTLGSYMSREASSRLRARVNAREDLASVNDKARFYRICLEARLAIPETFGVISAFAPTHRQTDPQTTRIDIGSLPDGSFVAKPAWGMKGKGIRFFEKAGPVFLVGGKSMDAESLRAVLGNEEPPDDFIVQRRVLPHPSLEAISGSKAVQSARIVTFLDSDNRPHVLFTRFKIVRRGIDVDNFANGETGNMVADVEIETGQITKVLMKPPFQIGLRAVTHHPDTGKDLLFQLPDWQQAIQLAHEGARAFPRLRSLAWDIALTPEGPVILEANQEWEIFPIGPYRRPLPREDWELLIR